MVSEPYNVRPGFSEHIILVKALLSHGQLKDVMQRSLELQSLYADALRDLEDSFYEHESILPSRCDDGLRPAPGSR